MSNICKILMLLLLTVLTVVVTASEFSKEFDSLVKEIILYEGITYIALHIITIIMAILRFVINLK